MQRLSNCVHGQYRIRNALRIDCITPVAYDSELLYGKFNPNGSLRIRQLIGTILLVLRRKAIFLFMSAAIAIRSRCLGKPCPNFAKGCCEDDAKCDYLHTSADIDAKALESQPDHQNKMVKLAVKPIGTVNSTAVFDAQSRALPIENLRENYFELYCDCSGFYPHEIEVSGFMP